MGEEKRGILDTSKDCGVNTQGLGGCNLLRCQMVREKQGFFLFFQRWGGGEVRYSLT